MLERTDVKDQISILLKRFDDLNKSHAAVVNAREQFQILQPLTTSSLEYGTVSRDIDDIEVMLEVIPGWFAVQKQQLLNDAITAAREQREETTSMQQKLATEKEDLEARKLGILQDIDNNGGKRLEQIETEIKQHEKDENQKKKDYDDYEKLSTSCGLERVANENDFHQNVDHAKNINNACISAEINLRSLRDTVISGLRKQESELKIEQDELQSLKERKTQIPAWLVGFRTTVCEDLNIDEDDLPFAGELMQVNGNETEWEGAIEKLLRDVGISLLVPKQHYRSVSRYVNDNVLRGPDGKGIKLTYLEADIDNTNGITRQPDNDSIVRKVDIKPDTIFYTWLEKYLQRIFGDFICVDVDQLQHVSYGITREGLIKSGKIRHTKDDRRKINDRRNYVLGWSNIEKIEALEEVIAILEQEIRLLKTELGDIEKEQKINGELKERINQLLFLKEYDRINWRYHADKIKDLEGEQKELLYNNDLLSLLHKNKDEVIRLIEDVKQREIDKNQEIGKLLGAIEKYEEQLRDTDDLIRQITPKQAETYFPVIERKIGDKKLQLPSIDKQQEQFRKLFEGDTGELKRLRFKLSSLRSAIEKKMREIKEHSKAEYSEIAESIDARIEYMNKFEKLSSEDLKRHEERFKEELNKNTINSIAVFDSQLEKHEKDIKQKIKTINQHLREIVYNATQGTYIIILMDPTPDKEVRLFREELKKCYIHSFSSDAGIYTEEKYEQVRGILDRFAGTDTSDKEWTNKVTDVRSWFEFNASECYAASGAEKEFYEGSGGKSGGQKEKLAYTILASALAYQFGLQFGESKSRSFRFVVIDEAFGRGSDDSTRYGLELFEKLNLQLLIVTPLQKIHIIEEHANSFHFVGNKEGNNSQVSNFTKAEYQKEKAKHNNMFQYANPQ
jgi:uncharacterized protein YPO0396